MKGNRWGWIGAALLALVLVPALASAQATQVGQLAGEVKGRDRRSAALAQP
jgi:hypothetical protein